MAPTDPRGQTPPAVVAPNGDAGTTDAASAMSDDASTRSPGLCSTAEACAKECPAADAVPLPTQLPPAVVQKMSRDVPPRVLGGAPLGDGLYALVENTIYAGPRWKDGELPLQTGACAIRIADNGHLSRAKCEWGGFGDIPANSGVTGADAMGAFVYGCGTDRLTHNSETSFTHDGDSYSIFIPSFYDYTIVMRYQRVGP